MYPPSGSKKTTIIDLSFAKQGRRPKTERNEGNMKEVEDQQGLKGQSPTKENNTKKTITATTKRSLDIENGAVASNNDNDERVDASRIMEQHPHQQHDEIGDEDDLSGEAAGVVRGVARSIGRGANPVLRAPIGQLPKSAGAGSRGVGVLRQQRLPVRQVARVSDRVSTGLDWWNSAVESSSPSIDDETATKTKTTTTPTARETAKTNSTTAETSSSSPSSKTSSSSSTTPSTSQSTPHITWSRLRSFATNILRNTFLGYAVFESYGYVIGISSPSLEDVSDNQHHGQLIIEIDDDNYDLERTDDDDDDENIIIVSSEPDEYARASVPVHFGAGCLAGVVHGIGSSVLEGHLTSHHSPLRYTVINSIHNGIAHSLLFGCYETIKRLCLSQLTMIHNEHDGIDSVATTAPTGSTTTQYYGGMYLASFAIAGGIAGQMQHVASHYTEHWLGLADDTLLKNRSTSSKIVSAPRVSIRPLFWSFPPSAIGFIAFEYGKKFTT